MAKILIVTGPFTGLLLSALELARRLGERGHAVSFAGPGSIAERVEARGLAFVELPASRYSGFLDEDREDGLFVRLGGLRERQERALSSLGVGNLGAVVDSSKIDLVLIDGELHEQIFSLWQHRARLVLLNTFVSIWRAPGVPPPHVRALPGEGWKGTRAGTALLWSAFLLRKRVRAWKMRIQRVGCDRISLLEELAAQNGVDWRTEIDTGQWQIPFTYRRLSTLSVHAIEFEFPHTPPARVRYVGPMVDRIRPEEASGESEARLTAALARRANEDGCSLIYAGFGSFWSFDRSILEALVATVRRRPEWHLVASVGRDFDEKGLDRPANVTLLPWVPQIRILPHCDVVVTHGGINTIDECVLAGVPMLVYCANQTDMAGSTSRVKYHRLGIVGEDDDGPDEIEERIDQLITETVWRSRVEALRRDYLRYREERVAERFVEHWLTRIEAGRSKH